MSYENISYGYSQFVNTKLNIYFQTKEQVNGELFHQAQKKGV